MNFMVIRTDDNGRSFLLRDNLSEHDARRLQQEMTARGHKQDYTTVGYDVGEQDRLLTSLGVVR